METRQGAVGSLFPFRNDVASSIYKMNVMRASPSGSLEVSESQAAHLTAGAAAVSVNFRQEGARRFKRFVFSSR
jgi:hypothetical protein